MKIVVLSGGLSPERDVSLSSGSLIANALMERGHEVLRMDVYLGDKEEAYRSRALGSPPYHYEIPQEEPDLDALMERAGGRTQLIGDGVLEACKTADVVFLALHGAMGENGQLQAVLDCYDIPYTGSGYAGSLLAMDKDLTKRLLRQSGIPTAPWSLLNLEEPQSVQVEFPCVVKPCACGSSVGVSIVKNEKEFKKAVTLARGYEKTVLIEQLVKGREFSVGVLNGVALPPIEIIPREGFYDYKNKYQAGRTREVCPANLSQRQTEEISTLALAVHRALRLGSYSRVDFILEEGTGGFVCLEANTLPGMTPVSLLPQEAEKAGIPYSLLCEQIALAALRKTDDNNSNKK